MGLDGGRGMELDRIAALRYAERLYLLQRLAVGESDLASFVSGRQRRSGAEQETP